MVKRKTKKKPSDAPIIVAGLLGVGVVGTLIDKMNVFGNNPDGKWWWERVFAPPTQATPVHALMRARRRRNMLRRQTRTPQLVHVGSGAGRPITRSDLARTVSKYVVT